MDLANENRQISGPVFEILQSLRSTPYDRESLSQFLAFAAPLVSRSNGQLFQDIWALWEAQGIYGGYFVEFGALDGVRLSNSYMLERDFRWDGIVAEPHPAFSQSLPQNRSCAVSTKCVWRQSGAKIGFLASTNAELARIADIVPADGHEINGSRVGIEVAVETISLNDLLLHNRAPNFVNFLSVDTEGSEYEILSAFDFTQTQFGSICIEHNGTLSREKIYDLLTGHGYRRKWEEFTQFDDWYVPVSR